MPDVRIGIDASGAAEGPATISKGLQLIRTDAVAAVQAVRDLAEQQQRLRQAQQGAQSQNTARQTQAVNQAATAQRRLKTAVDQTERSKQRAERAALQALSTLGGENRALSQRIVFENRLKTAVDAGVISQRRATALRLQANRVFSTASVNARDLRRNMQGLNQAVSALGAVLPRAVGPLLALQAGLGGLSGAIGGGGAAGAVGAGAVGGAATRAGLIGGIAAAGAGVLALGSVFAASIPKAKASEQSLAALEAITGATGDDLDDLRERAIALGGSFPRTASQVAEAFKIVGSLKPELLGSVEALAEVTEASLTLALAAGQTVPDASRALVNALNQYQRGAEGAAEFANALAAAQRLGSAEVNVLADGLARAGSVAATAGVSFEELLGTLGTLAALGLPMEQIATGLRNVFIVLSSGADETNPKVVGLQTALDNLAERFPTLGSLVNEFGRRNAVVALQLIQSRNKAVELAASITDTNEAEKQAAIRTDTFVGSLANLKSAFEEMTLRLNKANTPLRAFIDLATDAIRVVNQLSTSGGIGEAADALLDTVRFIVANNPSLEGLADLTGLQSLLDDRRARQQEDAAQAGRSSNRSLQREGLDALGFGPREATKIEAPSAELTQQFIDLIDKFDKAASSQKDLAAATKVLDEALRLGLIPTEEEHARLLALVTAGTVGRTDASKAATRALEEQRKKVAELAAAQAKAQQALSQEVIDLDAAIVARQAELEALRQGEAALREFNVQQEADVILRKLRAQAAKTGEDLSATEEESLRERARLMAELNEEIARETQARENQAARAEQQAEALRQPFVNAAESIQSAFTDAFEQILSGGVNDFEDFAEIVKRIFIRLAAEIATLLIFQPLLGNIAGGNILGGGQAGAGASGNLFGSIGQLFGFGGGGGAAPGAAGSSGNPISENNPLPVNIPGLGNLFGGVSTSIASLSTGVADFFGASVSAQAAVGNAVQGLLSNIGGLTAGGFLGSAAGSLIGVGQSSIGQIGSVVGSIVGGVIGSIIPGAGTTVGAAIGSLAGGSAFEGFEIAFKGGDPLDVQSDSAFKRFLVAELRTGGLTGGLGGTRAAFNAPEKPTGFLTGGLGEGFGVGLPASFIRAVSEFEQGLSRFLSTEEIARASKNLESRTPLVESFKQFDNEAVTISLDRIDAILESIVREAGKDPGRDSQIGKALVGDLTFDLFKKAGGFKLDFDKPGALEKIQEEVGKFLAERAAIRETINNTLAALQNPTVELTEIEQEVKRINRFFSELREDAKDFLLDDNDLARIEQGRKLALKRLKEEFEKSLRESIQQIEDPAGFAFAGLAKQFDELRRSAIAAGADILLVEKLVGLERVQLVKQFTGQAQDAIQGLLDNLTAGPASRLPGVERLALAESAFDTQRAGALAGDLDAINALAQAAANLLAVSEEVFASSGNFFERQAFVIETLRTVLAAIPNLDVFQLEGLRPLSEVESLLTEQTPGFQAGGSFRVPGGGGFDSTRVSFRATGGERVTVSPQGDLEERISSVGEAIVLTSAEDRQVLREIRKLMADQQQINARMARALERLASSKSREVA